MPVTVIEIVFPFVFIRDLRALLSSLQENIWEYISQQRQQQQLHELNSEVIPATEIQQYLLIIYI